MHKYCNLSRTCTACNAWLPEPGPEVDSVPSDTPISGESGELMAQTRCAFYIGGFGQNDCSWEQIPKAGVRIILEVRLILETRRYSPWNLLHEPDKWCGFRWPNDRRHPSFPTGARKSITTDRYRDHRSTSWRASSLDYLEELWEIAKRRASMTSLYFTTNRKTLTENSHFTRRSNENINIQYTDLETLVIMLAVDLYVIVKI